MPVSSTDEFVLDGVPVRAGERVELRLKVGETYTATPVNEPVTVIRGDGDGPVLGVLAALHGDELNGVAVVRRLLYEVDFEGMDGILVACPMVNVFGVMNRSRYLPDRRDLNRSFPGSPTGSSAARMAYGISDQVVSRCDALIDLHTAASGRTNLPQVRGDLTDSRVFEMARAFGTPFMINAVTRPGSLRETASARGIPVLIYEGGETFKFQTPVVEQGLTGVLNVMAHLAMVPKRENGNDFDPIVIGSSRWTRAEHGGILDLRVSLGEWIEEGQDLFATTNLFGRERSVIGASQGGYVVGLTTLPVVNPGDAVVHLGFPGGGPFNIDDEDSDIVTL
jgi:predicted deacylase